MSISDKHADEIVTHRLECKPLIESLTAALTTAEAQRDALAEALRGIMPFSEYQNTTVVVERGSVAWNRIWAALAALEG